MYFRQLEIYEHHDIFNISNLWNRCFPDAFPAPVLFRQQTYLHQKLLLSMAEVTSTGTLKRDHSCIFLLLLQHPYVGLQNWNQSISFKLNQLVKIFIAVTMKYSHLQVATQISRKIGIDAQSSQEEIFYNSSFHFHTGRV